MARNNDYISPGDILEKIVSVEGLYEKIFWKLLNNLVYNDPIDQWIHICKNIYGYSDASEVFRRKIDTWLFHRLTKTIFRFQELEQPKWE